MIAVRSMMVGRRYDRPDRHLEFAPMRFDCVIGAGNHARRHAKRTRYPRNQLVLELSRHRKRWFGDVKRIPDTVVLDDHLPDIVAENHRRIAGFEDSSPYFHFLPPHSHSGSKYRKSALHQSNDKNSNQCEARCSIIERVRKKTELTFHALLVLAAPRALPPKAARIDCLRVRNRYSPYAEAFSSLEATR